MCRWSEACWVDPVREDCHSVYYSALVGKMTSFMTETLFAYGSLLSTTLYITYKWFLTVKVQFHLYNPPFNLPSTDIVAPTGLLSWLACCLCWKNRNSWPRRTRAYPHPFFDFDYEKKSICMHPMWIQKTMLHPSLPCFWAMTYTYSLLIIAFCCCSVALVTYRHPCWRTSFLPCAIQKK